MLKFVVYFIVGSLLAFGQDSQLEMLPEYEPLAIKRAEVSEQQDLSTNAKEILLKAKNLLESKFKDGGLKVGDKAYEFELINAEGESVRLSDLAKKSPVVLCFYHGNWCPYCNIEFHVLVQSLSFIKKLKGTLVFISPQSQEFSKAMKEKFPGDYYILSDSDYNVCKEYQVYYELPKDLLTLYRESFHLDLELYNGKGRFGLPIAATYIINQKGEIAKVFFDTNYRKRMEPKEILVFLYSLLAVNKRRE